MRPRVSLVTLTIVLFASLLNAQESKPPATEVEDGGATKWLINAFSELGNLTVDKKPNYLQKMSANERSRLLKFHLALHLAVKSDFSTEQRRFIIDAIVAASSTVYASNRDDQSILMIAINRPIDEDAENQAFLMIRNRGFSFPVAVLAHPNFADRIGVTAYPTTIVINRHGVVVFKGSIEWAEKVVQELKASSS